MYGFLIALIAIVAVLLCVIILIQSGKGGGLAASFGGTSSSTDSFMGGRQAATALTKMTWIGGGVFLFLSLVLAVMSSRPQAAPDSILRDGLPGQQVLPEAPPSLLDAAPNETEGDAAPGTVPEGGTEGAVPEGSDDEGSGND